MKKNDYSWYDITESISAQVIQNINYWTNQDEKLVFTQNMY